MGSAACAPAQYWLTAALSGGYPLHGDPVRAHPSEEGQEGYLRRAAGRWRGHRRPVVGRLRWPGGGGVRERRPELDAPGREVHEEHVEALEVEDRFLNHAGVPFHRCDLEEAVKR